MASVINDMGGIEWRMIMTKNSLIKTSEAISDRIRIGAMPGSGACSNSFASSALKWSRIIEACSPAEYFFSSLGTCKTQPFPENNSTSINLFPIYTR